MTPNEAIKTIDMAISEVEWEYPMEYAVAFDVAKEALKKQIPKKPVIDMIAESTTMKLYYDVCPTCHHYIKRFEIFEGTSIGERFCGGCGQSIDWSDKE